MASKLAFIATRITPFLFACCADEGEGGPFVPKEPGRSQQTPFAEAELVVTQEEQHLAPDGAPSDLFGYSVAISGDTLIVGAPYDDTGGTDAGAAYVFVRQNGAFAFQQKLGASVPGAAQWFGQAVALSGDMALVGAPYATGAVATSGAAYVFVRSNGVWSEAQKVFADDGNADDRFGHALAISKGSLLIGAPNQDAKGSDSGAAYVFVQSGAAFAQQKKLLSADGAAGDSLGSSVALDGDSALIGAPNDDDAGQSSGSAYIFVRAGTSWSQQKKLGALSGLASDRFGSAVAIVGDTALVGAPGSNAAAVDAGAGYLFSRTGLAWDSGALLVPNAPAAGDELGGSVALNAQAALLGAAQNDAKGGNAGAAWLFLKTPNGYAEDLFLVAKDGTGGDSFGFSVALGSDTALVGAYLEDKIGTNAGAAYTFVLKNALGDPCQSALECASGFCVDGVCCDTACSAGECDSCNDGTCALLDGNPCEDGDACTVSDTCQAGECKSGEPTGCPEDAGVDAEADAATDAAMDANGEIDAAPELDAAADAEADADTKADVRIAGGACSLKPAQHDRFALACVALTCLLLGYRRRRAS